MKLENEKTRSYLRIFFCMVLIIIWATWIINAPTSKRLEQGTENKEPETGIKKLEEQDSKPETQNSPAKGGSASGGKLETQVLAPKKIELPKLADLEPKDHSSESKAKIKKSAINSQVAGPMIQVPVVKLPEVALATRKVLLQDNSHKDSESNKKETLLRKKVPINNSAIQKSKSEDEVETSWLPKYIIEKNELPNTIKNLTSNLDQIASQIDFTGLIKSIQGPGAAIIKNNANNTIEILKIGEEYKGLQLLEINENEITLGNPELEKKYIKKLITQIKDQ